MSEVSFKAVKISDIFTNQRGNSKYTQKYCNEHKGEYEVFTGTTIGSFAFIDSYDYEEDLLTYTTDGENAGTLKILKGKFNVGGHRAILTAKVEGLVLEYFQFTLQKTLFECVKRGDVPSINWRSFKDKYVSIPVNEEGNYDMEKQREIVSKFEMFEKRKQEIKIKLDYLNEVNIDFISTGIDKCKIMTVNDIFDLSIGTNGSKFTKSFIKMNSGDIPVYGASRDNIPSYGYVNDNAIIIEKKDNETSKTPVRYFEDCLTYNIDGLAGYIFYRKGKFSLSEKVRPLIIKDQYKDLLSPEYLKYVLEPVFRENVKGRKGKNGKNEYTKLNVKMIKNIEVKIPIKDNDQFDLETQIEIVKKYEIINRLKADIISQALPFTLANLNFSEESLYIHI